jgi:hypothetical protein
MDSSIRATLDFDVPSLSSRVRDNRFYFTMACTTALGVFGGFARLYYLKSYFHTPELPLLLHVHAAIFTIWLFFFILQTALISNGRFSAHRWFGWAGAILAGVMVVSGVSVSFWMVSTGHFRTIPFVRDAEGACLFALGQIVMFCLFMASGFQFRRNREIHQRSMLMATVWALAPNGLGKLGALISPPVAPLLIYSFVLAGPIYDLATRRRVHPAYIWGLPVFILLSPPIIIILGKTQGWHTLVHWMMSR